MRVTVTPVGASFDAILTKTVTGLTKANRDVGREVARVGSAAIRKGAPSMTYKGKTKRLGVRTRVRPASDGCEVEFYGVSAGGWAIHESGARPHDITPRKGRQGHGGRPAALRFGGLDAARVRHPGTKPGTKAWTKAGERMIDAVDPIVRDAYDEALDA